MKLLLIQFRDEVMVSGEAASTRGLVSALRSLGNDVRSMQWRKRGYFKISNALAKLRQLRSTDWSAEPADAVIVKVPTAAQIPFVRWAMARCPARLIVLIDGFLWNPRLRLGQWLKLAVHEPLLLCARMIANNSFWAWLSKKAQLEMVVASESQRAELSALLPAARVAVIPNGTFGITPAPPSGRREHFRVGYLGHSYLTKGVWELLRAGKLSSVQVRWAISGLGSRRFVKAVSNSGSEILAEVDVPEFLESIDVLAVPYWSAWGTQVFPNVLLEAMRLGVPVLTSDIPVYRELFPGDLAHFVPPGDALALADKLKKLASGVEPLPTKGQLQDHFQKHYSDDRITKRWAEMLSAPPKQSLGTPHVRN